MTSTSTDRAVVRLQRTIPAAPERVFRAWLDPDLMPRWFGGIGKQATGAVVEERVGGRHAIYQEADGEDAGGFENRIVELDPPHRLVLDWGFCGPDRVLDPSHTSRVTVTFEPDGDAATTLTLVHERLDALAAARPGTIALAETAWTQALDKLDAVV